jgi:hypothetical protein
MREFAPDVYHPFKWRDWQDLAAAAWAISAATFSTRFSRRSGSPRRSASVRKNDGNESADLAAAETISSVFFPGQRI